MSKGIFPEHNHSNHEKPMKAVTLKKRAEKLLKNVQKMSGQMVSLEESRKKANESLKILEEKRREFDRAMKIKGIVKKQLRDWCKECCFDPYIPEHGPDKGNKTKYLVSKKTSPKPYECTECFYKLLQYGKVEVTKPENWRKHEGKQ